MPTKTTKQTHLLQDRLGVIDKCDLQVHIHVDHPRGRLPTRISSVWLELEGVLNEAVSDSTRFSLHVLPGNPGDLSEGGLPSIGSWIRVRPMLQGVVNVTDAEFSVLMQLASAGKLTTIGLAFAKPFRNHALIMRVSFGSESVE